MTSSQAGSSTQNICIHTASSTGMCQCKIEMHKNFQDFTELTGDTFEKQLNEKTKKLRDFSDKLLRENLKLKKDNEKVDALQKLYENVSRQVSLHETLIDKHNVDMSNLTDLNKQLQVKVHEVTGRNEELQVTVNELQVTVADLTNGNKQLEVTVQEVTGRNEELQVTVQEVTGRNEELQVTVRELQAAVKEMQNRMKVVEDKTR